MSIKVAIVGAESTGKSTLATKLAEYYDNKGLDAGLILEYAREWIDEMLDGDMDRLKFKHITHFGEVQMSLVRIAERIDEHDIIFSDTDAIVSSVFQQVYYGKVDEKLIKEANDEKWDLVLFTQTDVPWVDDGQRNLSDKREEINNMFKEELIKRKMNYVEVKGNWEERFNIAINSIDHIIWERKNSLQKQNL